MSKVLGVSKSGFYKYIKYIDTKKADNNTLSAQIAKVFDDSYKTYGSPRIAQSLNNNGIDISKTSVARHMKQMGISVRYKRKFMHTTKSDHQYKVADNLSNRSFVAKAPNQVWVSDITFLPCGNGFVYLTIFLDLFVRAIVGWALSDNMSVKNNTSIAALSKAFSNRMVDPNNNQSLMIHSDRGVQFAYHEFIVFINSYNYTQSTSRKGYCWDNAVAESFFKTIKSERLDNPKIQYFDMAYSACIKVH